MNVQSEVSHPAPLRGAWRRRLAAALLPLAWPLVLPFVLAACGGGGGNDPGVSTLRPPVQAEIGSAGGTVKVPISEGVQAEIEFPAGALRETVSMTFTPEPPEAGAQVRLRVEPADPELAKPVILRLTGAAAPASGTTAFYVGSRDNRMFVPSATDPATGALTAQTQLLVLDADTALAARADRPRILAAGPLTSGSHAGFINVDQQTCQILLPELEAQIRRAKQSEFTANSVYQLVQTIRVIEPLCAGEGGGDGSAVEAAELLLKIEEIERAACASLVNAVDAIMFFLDPTEADFYGRTTRLLGAQAALDAVGGSCNPQVTTMQAYAKAMTDYMAAFSRRVDAPGFGGNTWLSRRNELRRIIRLYDDAFGLEMLAEQQAVVDTVLKPALAKLHARAFRTCDRDNPAEQGQLADLMTGGQVYGSSIAFLAFDGYGRTLIPPGIAQDIQYCASRLSIQAFDGAEPLPSQTLVLGGGDEPGTQETQGTITVPVAEGVLSIEGVVRPLLCASPQAAAAYDPSTLVIKFNGVTIRELSPTAADFLPEGPLELDLQAMYAAAGLDANAPGAYALEIFRVGTGCGGVFGAASFKLFEVTVTSTGAAPSVAVLGSSTMADLTGLGAAACFGNAQRIPSQNGRAEVEGMTHERPGPGQTNCQATVPGVSAKLSARRSLFGPDVSTPPVTGLPVSYSGRAELFERIELDITNPAAAWQQSASASARVEVQGTWVFQASGAPVAYSVILSASGDPGMWMSLHVMPTGQDAQSLHVCPRGAAVGSDTTFKTSYCKASADAPDTATSRTVSGVLQPGQVLQIDASAMVEWQGLVQTSAFGASRLGESGFVQGRGVMNFEVTFSAP